MTRPEPWGPPPEGYHFEAAEETVEGWHAWRVVVGHRLCRMRGCREVAVVELNREKWRPGRYAWVEGRASGKVPCWWAYCAEHMYGRWLEDGRIYSWRLREN